MRREIIVLSALCLAAAGAQAESAKSAGAMLHDAQGKEVGTVVLRQGADNGVWLDARFNGLAPGTHAFHIHETGKCEGDFKSAGGHYAPAGHKHGMLVEGGPHGGDLPNIHVPSDGTLQVEVFAPGVSLTKGASNTLFDEDGSAFVVHQGADDYASQPAGAAGARIACGVITSKASDSAQR